jgi:putative endonuclease
MYTVYVLRNKHGRLYVGQTRDIKRRLLEHNEGKVSASAAWRPFTLIYCECFNNRTDAMRRELYLKTGWGRNYLRRTLVETFKNLGG